MIPRFLWTVYGFSAERCYQPEPVAIFFSWGDAASFAMHPEEGFEQRNLYIDEGRYDRRASGYVPAEPLVETVGDPLKHLEPRRAA